MAFRSWCRNLFLLSTLTALPVGVFAKDVLSTDGFTECLDNPNVQVTALNVAFDRSTGNVTFDVAGSSTQEQKVTAQLSVSAYGHSLYNKTFNPCDPTTFVEQLCPVPAGTFSAVGNLAIPQQYIDQIPSIAYNIPDLGGDSKLELFTEDGQAVACVEATVGNGKTTKVAAVQYAAVGIAGAALVLSGASALSAVGHSGASTSSPTFIEVIGWFQTMATSGMLSVNYPGIYRSFTQNFGFSTGLITWTGLQESIDSFRQKTGGNLTDDNIQYLQNATIVYTDGSSKSKRALDYILSTVLDARQVQTNVNGSTTNVGGSGDLPQSNSTTPPTSGIDTVSGIQAFSEKLLIPHSNTFMTVLLIFAIAIAGITAGILLFKVILEAWAIFGKFPKNLEGFRKRYWWLLGKTITNLILALYGVWVMYCIYQFKIGDSWAAKLLAGVTLGLFTLILVGFTLKIWLMARKAKRVTGDASALYEDKEIWVRYSIFYDNYKKSYWWLFVPVIIYMFAKGCVIAGGEGNGMVQCAGQLILDSLLLILLLFIRPYHRKSGNWINIVIQVVRVLSVACILVFVEELGISQTTKTVVGVVLIVLQAVLTTVLALLIVINALVNCIRTNPHRRARKEAAKANKLDEDELTPLDAHNSWLMQSMGQKKHASIDVTSIHTRGRSQNGYDEVSSYDRDLSREPLAKSGAGMASQFSFTHDHSRSGSPDLTTLHRQPQLPDLEYKGRGGMGVAM